MALTLRVGARYRSTVCETEVVIIRVASDRLDLRCGGEAMAAIGDDETSVGQPKAPFDAGTLVGKRYAAEDETVEVLCTKAGAGSLSVGVDLLSVKASKPLPSSD